MTYEEIFMEGYLDAIQSIDVLYDNDAIDCEECNEDDFDMYSDDDFDEELDEGFVSAMRAVIDKYKPRKKNINTALKKRAKAEAKFNKAFEKMNKAAGVKCEQLEFINAIQEEFDKYFDEEDVIRYLVQRQGFSVNEAIDIYNEGFIKNMIMKKTNPAKYALYQRAKQERKVVDAQAKEANAQSKYSAVVSRQGYDDQNTTDTKRARRLQHQRNKAMKQTDKAVTKFNKATTPKKPGFFARTMGKAATWKNNTAMKSGRRGFERQAVSRPTMNQTQVVKTAKPIGAAAE